MIRWRYLLPRLVLLAAAVAIVWLVKDVAIRYGLGVSGEQVARAKVDVGPVTSSLGEGVVGVSGLEVADARRPGFNLFTADAAGVNLDTWALLQGRLVIEDAALVGLEFGTARADSGLSERLIKLPDVHVPDLTLERMRIAAGVAEGSAKLIEPLGLAALAMAREKVEEEIRKMPLASIQQAEAVRAQWLARYAQIDAQVEGTKQRLQTIWQQITSARGSLLEKLPLFEQATREFENLRQSMQMARQMLDELPNLARQDIARVQAAVEADIQMVRDRINAPLVDAESLTRYLLSEEFEQQLVTVTQAIKTVRSLWPADTLEPSLPALSRGRVVEFGQSDKLPDLLVRRATLSGRFEWRGKPTEFTARLFNLTDRPKDHAEPIRLEAEFTADATYTIEATFDSAGDEKVAQVLASVDGLKMPARRLGRGDDFALDLLEQPMRVDAAVTVSEKSLDGIVTWRLGDARLANARWATVRVADPRLQALLARVQNEPILPPEVVITIAISGPPEKPEWHLSSNLGPQIARNINRALIAQANEIRDEMTARLRAGVTAQLAGFENSLLADRDSMLARLEVNLQQIQQHQTFLRSQLTRVTQARLLGIDPDKVERLNEKLDEFLPQGGGRDSLPPLPELKAETMLDRLLR
jgi:uncharacterized protein (TIGR03545 family)